MHALSVFLQILLPIGIPALFLLVMHLHSHYGEFWKPLIGIICRRKPILRETMDPKSLFTLMNHKRECRNHKELVNAATRLLIHIRDKSWFAQEDERIFRMLYEEELERVLKLEKQQQREWAKKREWGKSKPNTAYEAQVSGWRAILAVPKNVNDASVVKKYYRKLAMQHHPDRGGKVEEMAKINRAYELARKELSF